MPGLYVHSMLEPVVIGEDTFMNQDVYFDVGAAITIGDHCQIGHGCKFVTNAHAIDTDFQSRRPNIAVAPVVIEDCVWLGCNVVVLPGVCIGKGSVVAAGSIVTKDIPPNSLYAGVPAKFIRAINL
jgi:acetyltransferase-like isoleucine patch superfamily enzyme